MIKTMASLAYLLLCVTLAATAQTKSRQQCPMVKIQPERLPDLPMARASHATFCSNGEIVVVGGHTDGFVPTATADYFSQGRWHTVNTIYTHDSGFSVQLKSGKVLIAGGCSEALGIGQTFTAELYDPATHRFEGFGCLDRKRTMASALEIDSGRVLIAGNWYADDDIELFDGKRSFTHVKSAAVQRSNPYIFRTAKDNAIIFSCQDTCANKLEDIVVDRLKGEPFRVDLFRDWHLLMVEHRNEDCFMGDEKKGIYEYILPVVNRKGQVAIARVSGETFSLLPTDCPVPMVGPGSKDSIRYVTGFIVDRRAQCAYMLGVDKQWRLYILRLSDQSKLTLFYTDPMTDAGFMLPVLTPEGNLVMAGGISDNNFKPFTSVLLFRLADRPSSFALSQIVGWGVVGLLLLLLVLFLLNSMRRKEKAVVAESAGKAEADASHPTEGKEGCKTDNLMDDINILMNKQQLFLNHNLKVNDVAIELNTNPRYVSDCIKAQCGCTFSQYVNNLRIEYAKNLMRNQPDIKMAEVALSAGFSNETTFFRTFKGITGQSPKEWMNSPET